MLHSLLYIIAHVKLLGAEIGLLFSRGVKTRITHSKISKIYIGLITLDELLPMYEME